MPEKLINLENLNSFKEELEKEIPAEVIANPTLVGDEAALNGIQIGTTKYAVGGGSSSPLHMYACYGLITINSQNISVRFIHLTEKDNLSTYKDVANDMNDKNMFTHNKVYSCCGDFSLGNGSIVSLVGVSGTSGSNNRDKLTVYYQTITIDFANQSIAQSAIVPDSTQFNTSLAFSVAKIF